MRVLAALLLLPLPLWAEQPAQPAPQPFAQPKTQASAQPSECKVLQATGDRFCKYGNRWRLDNARPAAFAPGDAFPVYQHSMLMDLRPYRLPPVDGPWRYYLHEGFIYKVSAATGEVLEVVGRARRR